MAFILKKGQVLPLAVGLVVLVIALVVLSGSSNAPVSNSGGEKGLLDKGTADAPTGSLVATQIYEPFPSGYFGKTVEGIKYYKNEATTVERGLVGWPSSVINDDGVTVAFDSVINEGTVKVIRGSVISSNFRIDELTPILMYKGGKYETAGSAVFKKEKFEIKIPVSDANAIPIGIAFEARYSLK